MKHFLIVAIVALVSSCMSGQSFAGLSVWLNEIHYDNDGGDVGEAIEVITTTNSNVDVALYNGANGATYTTTTISASDFTDLGNGFWIASKAISGIQNGAPDGIALQLGSDVQFLSYEGAFIASGGIADGMMSTDIGVSEGSSTPIGQSLQLIGMGSEYSDFMWQSPRSESFGSVNQGQTLSAVPEPTSLILVGMACAPMLLRRRSMVA